MVLISDGGMPVDVGAITQVLQELRIDNVTIAAITEALMSGVERVEGYEPAQVPESRFGTLPNGASLGHHTELARRAVREAIVTMVDDLRHYNESVVTFRKGFNVADEHAREDLDHIAAQVADVASAKDGGLDS